MLALHRPALDNFATNPATAQFPGIRAGWRTTLRTPTYLIDNINLNGRGAHFTARIGKCKLLGQAERYLTANQTQLQSFLLGGGICESHQPTDALHEANREIRTGRAGHERKNKLFHRS